MAPLMRIACIVNPHARDGKLGNNFPKVEAELRKAEIEFDVFMTEGCGHAIEISSNLRETDHDLVVAVGGDGTVHEVANGLRKSKQLMGIIPMGNGDDFLLRVVYRVNSNPVTRLRLIELLTKHTRDNVDTVLLSCKNLFQKGLYAVF